MQAERVRLREGTGQPIDVLLICAGRRGGRSLALEDMVCAGALCHELLLGDGDLEASDGAQLARELYLAHRADLLGLLKSCQSGRNLAGLGQAADVELSAQLDSLPLVCRWDGRSVVSGR
jgi:2-phosphosulfolactate phosphatase